MKINLRIVAVIKYSVLVYIVSINNDHNFCFYYNLIFFIPYIFVYVSLVEKKVLL